MPRFTRDTAKTASALGNQIRWSRFHEAKEKAIPEPEPPDDYQNRRLFRVRKQLDRIDKMMMTECDPQKLDRLASAQSRLADQERIIRGEPLPGSRRPSKEPTARRVPTSIMPTEPGPAAIEPPSTTEIPGVS
jgi:hypothetical protein